jgi:hypothetical protein
MDDAAVLDATVLGRCGRIEHGAKNKCGGERDDLYHVQHCAIVLLRLTR